MRASISASGTPQAGDILWKVTDQTDRENPSCSGATQTYSWSNPGTKYVDVWLTNEENGTSNKTEWVVIMSTDVKGYVKDNSNNPLISNITYYDTDGETALDNITSSTFNFTGVPEHIHTILYKWKEHQRRYNDRRNERKPCDF
jgi:hypothetical protein